MCIQICFFCNLPHYSGRFKVEKKKKNANQQRIARKIYQVHTAAEVRVKLEHGRVRSYFRLSRRIAGSFQEQWVLIGLDVCD